MSLASTVNAVDISRRRRTTILGINVSGNYVPGGDPLDLTQAANPHALQGGSFGKVPTEWIACNAPGGYTAEYIPSKGGARTPFLTTAFTQPGGVGTALKFTTTVGDTLSGSIEINSAGGTHAGTQVVNLATYSGLSSAIASTVTAAAAALTAALNASLGATTGSTYTVTVAAGVVSITPTAGGSAGETLSVTASTVQEWAAGINGQPQLQTCAVKFFSADGTELAAAAYPAALQADTLLLALSVKMYAGM
jgi:hypothetical protein